MKKRITKEQNTPAKPCLVIDNQGNFYKCVPSKFLIGHNSLEKVTVLNDDCVFKSKSVAGSAICHFNKEILDSGGNPRDLFITIKELTHGDNNG
jgi:hypothetical protein